MCYMLSRVTPDQPSLTPAQVRESSPIVGHWCPGWAVVPSGALIAHTWPGQHPAPTNIMIHRGQRRGDQEKRGQVILTILTTAYCLSEMRKFTQGFHVTRDHVSAPGPCEGGLSLGSVFSQVNKNRLNIANTGPRRPPTAPHNGTLRSRKS